MKDTDAALLKVLGAIPKRLGQEGGDGVPADVTAASREADSEQGWGVVTDRWV